MTLNKKKLQALILEGKVPAKWHDGEDTLATVERLREILVATLVADHCYSLEDAESVVVLGANLDDVHVRLPAPLAAQHWPSPRRLSPPPDARSNSRRRRSGSRLACVRRG